MAKRSSFAGKAIIAAACAIIIGQGIVANTSAYSVNYDTNWLTLTNYNGDEALTRIINTSDGGYLTAGWGETLQGDAHNQVIYVKYSASGVKQWEGSYGVSTSNNYASSIVEVDDSYIMSGNSYGSSDTGYIFKIDKSGNLVDGWGGTIDIASEVFGLKMEDGELAAYGTVKADDSSFRAVINQSTGQRGRYELIANLGNAYNVPTSDGCYITAVSNTIYKIDADEEIVWSTEVNGAYYFNNAVELNNGTIAVVGVTTDNPANAFIVELNNEDGEIISGSAWGSTGYDAFYSIVDKNGNPIIVGETNSTEITGTPTSNREGFIMGIKKSVTATISMPGYCASPSECTQEDGDYIYGDQSTGVGGDYTWVNGENNLPTPTDESGKYVFDGWYLDANFTQKYDPSVAPASDLVLYSRWAKKTTNPDTVDNSINFMLGAGFAGVISGLGLLTVFRGRR